jgi:hypothetical protein
MLLNFKKQSNDLTTVTVHDGYGCSLEIPTRGYVDATEYSEAMRLILTASDENRLHTVERDIVAFMLISRFDLPRNTSPEKIFKVDDDGTSIGAPMLKSLFKHFMDELGGEKDMLKFPLGHYSNMTQDFIDIKTVTVSDSVNNQKRQKQPVEA